MIATSLPQMEQNIARCRVVLSVVALIAVFIDPTQPLISRWIPMKSGRFLIDPYALTVITAHFCYSLGIVCLLTFRVIPHRLVSLTTWGDVAFGAAIAVFTEGITSPFYAFFAFAVVEAGLRAEFRHTLMVTAISVALYLSLIVVSAGGNTNFYIMRPVYLAIAGYLVGYLGQQRLNLEAGIRELAAANQRQQIARDLHDGRAQALAGISLQLETCQGFLQQGAVSEALFELSDLQASVNREYDELRAYMRSLVGLEATAGTRSDGVRPRFSVEVRFDGSGDLLTHVFQILREAVTNVLRHAHARRAAIRVGTADSAVRITIDDDGVGFGNSDEAPWSMSSLVLDLGGVITLARDEALGAHVAITIPTGEG